MKPKQHNKSINRRIAVCSRCPSFNKDVMVGPQRKFQCNKAMIFHRNTEYHPYDPSIWKTLLIPDNCEMIMEYEILSQ